MTAVEVIFKHEIRIHRKPTKWSHSRDKVAVEKQTVLAQNDSYVVLEDMHFTKLEKKGDGFVYSAINKPNIYFKDVLGEQGVFYTLYATCRKRLSTIEKEIRAKAEKEYGWLFSKDLDLSALNEGVNLEGESA